MRYVNEALVKSEFPDSLKLSNIVRVHKKENSTDKTNYRFVSVLQLLSKVFDEVMYLNNCLNDLLCGFRKVHSTQNALFSLIQSRKKELVGTILMDLLKGYECLPHKLLTAKIDVYGLDKCSINLVNDY